ncbi:hypothetical protein AB0H43_13425 [Hamadaea sp. NPDC050747]|uniref:hypothetical protein n=1 Tax=Hamadaea sp. NPDC050747 TaxID=3155789 RepID=UPI00340152BA
MAIDLRIRSAFTVSRVPSSVHLGIRTAGVLLGRGIEQLGRALEAEFLALTEDQGSSVRGRSWTLPTGVESRLDRMCVALSWYERTYRDGCVMAASPLRDPALCQVGDLLRVVPDEAVRDLQVQVRLAERALGDLRDDVAQQDCVSGPEFAGSSDVGGADGDLLVGDVLLEMKASSRPDFLSDQAIWQLAGYALLDYDDDLGIRSVALYQTRLGWCIRWPIEQFFHTLARQQVSDLRAGFRRQLQCERDARGSAV